MNKITEELLKVVADYEGNFDGAYNIREDGACVMRLLISLAVNTTAGNDGDVCIFSDKKVIIYLILHAAVRHAGRNIDFFPFCAGFYVNLQSFSICP